MAIGNEPGHKYQSLIAPLWDSVEIYEGPDVFRKTFRSVRREAALLYAANFCRSEVCNGGFFQFFCNSTGVLAPEAVKGFTAIGQIQIAGIVKQAMKLTGTPYIREKERRSDALPSSEVFRPFNKRFFALTDTEAGGFAVAADRYAEFSGG